MLTANVGTDEFRFGEQHHSAADNLMAAWPDIRRRGTDITGSTGPPSLRIVISTQRPRIRDLLRPTSFFIVLWLLFAAALLAAVLAYRSSLAAELLLIHIAAWSISLGGSALIARISWPRVAGLAMPTSVLVEPVIALHWPPLPAPPIAAQLMYRVPEGARLPATLAHEYAHVLLSGIHQSKRLPAWLDEGFADWFMEHIAGRALWRPESRSCVQTPEPKRDPRRRFLLDPHFTDQYYRLEARYYWEIRTIADQGRLPELLRTPLRRVNKLRPSLLPDSHSAQL